jgi:beta-lactam-binding protein with PASTA domain
VLYFFSSDPEETPTTEVPQLQGKTLDQAEKLLQQAHLEVGEETPERSETAPRGEVLRQSQQPGAIVDEGTTIDLVYSAGQKMVIIPGEVLDMTLSEATAALHDAGLKVDPQRDDESSERANEVTGTDPGVGQRVPAGSIVTVLYSSGFKVVPSVVGMSEEEAVQAIEGAGLRAVTSNVESDRPQGDVVGQTPPGGRSLPFNDPVIIQVSLGPQETPTQTQTQQTTPTSTATTTPTSTNTGTPGTTPPT